MIYIYFFPSYIVIYRLPVTVKVKDEDLDFQTELQTEAPNQAGGTVVQTEFNDWGTLFPTLYKEHTQHTWIYTYEKELSCTSRGSPIYQLPKSKELELLCLLAHVLRTFAFASRREWFLHLQFSCYPFSNRHNSLKCFVLKARKLQKHDSWDDLFCVCEVHA